MFKKIFIFIQISIYLCAHHSYCQEVKEKIQRADSLFLVNKYEEAGKLYEQVFYNNRLYSQKMLLQLAFIASQSKDFVRYLYWLNLYLQVNPDAKIAEKIENTANAYELVGYEISDRRWFLIYYHYYYKFIVLGFCVLTSVFLMLFFLNKQSVVVFRRNGVLLLLYLVGTILLHNVVPPIKEAVVAGENTYLMQAPSSASQVAGLASKGQKVSVVGENDIWLEIVWNKQRVFVKKSQVYFANLF
jgi:hypothetical protein